MKALDIIYKDVVKDFKIDDEGRLFRLWRGVEWREVEIKDNSGNGYCCVRWGNKKYKMHRILYSLYHEIDVDCSLVIDHIDGNRINNTKDNLRLISQRENTQNRVKHRNGKLQGASRQKSGKWQALIVIRGRKISLGYYDTQIEAHQAYLQACEMVDKTIQEIKQYFGVAQFTSKIKGVCFDKAEKKWRAQATINGKQKYLGLFTTENEAAQAIELALEGKASIGTALSVL